MTITNMIKHIIPFTLSVLLLFAYNGCKKETPNQTATTNAKPVVAITSPANNTIILDTVTIQISATDDKKVTLVEIFVDDSLRGTFTAPPYISLWDVRGFPDRTIHTLYAKAHDASGNISTSATVLVGTRVTSSDTLLPQMIFVPGGIFWMGDTLHDFANTDQIPVHKVTLHEFYLGQKEVTQAEWQHVVVWKQTHGGTTLNAAPSYFFLNRGIAPGDTLRDDSSGLRPVEQVSWDDITLWLSHLNEMTGTDKYRLPTEAEWEYAARGRGALRRYAGTNELGYLVNYAWYYTNSLSRTHKTGLKLSNEIGIKDMSGNVWEWVSDWYGAYSIGIQTNPTGPSTGTYRVVRGGSWGTVQTEGAAAYRDYLSPAVRDNSVGFRIARAY